MHSARRTWKAVILFSISAGCCFTASSQTSQTVRFEKTALSRPFPAAPTNLCGGREEPAASSLRPISNGIDIEPFPCEVSGSSVASVQPLEPCKASGIRASGCTLSRDFVLENLATRGKTGEKISQVRERILDILQGESACTQWYRTKDPNPAATFRTLSFELDLKGQDYIIETKSADELTTFHNPYVARVIQGNGSYATITLNAHGAFFFAMANLEQAPPGGGTLYFRGVRPLQVGPYAGNTMTAQILTLLHEFGHLLELLPIDEGDRDGQSVRNSKEVLRYCRAEIESAAKTKSLFPTQ